MHQLHVVLVSSHADSKQRMKECLRVGIDVASIQIVAEDGEYGQLPTEYPDTSLLIVTTRSHQSRKETVRALRKAVGEKGPPILALVSSGDSGGSQITEILSAGCDGLILEPLSAEAVAKALQHVVQSERFVDFTRQRELNIMKVMFAGALSAIDASADRRIKKQRMGIADFREWKLISDNVKDTFSKLGPDAFANGLASVCALREPFPPREAGPVKKTKRNALHPAKVVAKVMATRGITTDKLAAAMRMDLSTIESFLNEAIEMNEELAENLARVVGHDKDYWMRLGSPATLPPL